jgi:Na+/phosphate symporter
MNTLHDIILESSNFLDEFKEVETISKEEIDKKTNKFLDNLLELQNKIDSISKHYEKGIHLLEKFTWVTDKGEFTEEEFKSINEIKIASKTAYNSGIRDYVFFNNRFKKLASKNIRVLKDTLDDFKETSEEICEILLNNYSDPELNEIEKRLNKL